MKDDEAWMCAPIVDLDASAWKTPNDIYAALFKALGSPDWHGDSPDALIDSMIWGGINELEPPTASGSPTGRRFLPKR